MNRAALGKIAPTDTTCADFVNGTAGDLNAVLYTIKRGKINSVAPGVFSSFSHKTYSTLGWTCSFLNAPS